jgi:hypothetical protein
MRWRGRYDPRRDPVVRRIRRAKTARERKKVEREAVTQSDNRPKPADPKRHVR